MEKARFHENRAFSFIDPKELDQTVEAGSPAMAIGIYTTLQRPALDLAFDRDLGRPVNHAGRNSTSIWRANCRSELARENRPGNAFILSKRGNPEFFASKLAPTKSLN
ncbi:hypothetical protein [Pseudomonas sp. R5-89-07]|uniref:hypothetical protein n=1 Tax=Pseudomonas sp. R5-89-07 TaxID=658644 RepID=UPI000F56465E|nr:hypothetical protein [Pseudomonas sp. R5-89-07]